MPVILAPWPPNEAPLSSSTRERIPRQRPRRPRTPPLREPTPFSPPSKPVTRPHSSRHTRHMCRPTESKTSPRCHLPVGKDIRQTLTTDDSPRPAPFTCARHFCCWYSNPHSRAKIVALYSRSICFTKVIFFCVFKMRVLEVLLYLCMDKNEFVWNHSVFIVHPIIWLDRFIVIVSHCLIYKALLYRT